MNQNNLYFKLFSNCIAVKGARKSTICDLQRGFYIEISNDCYDLVIELKTNTINNVFNRTNCDHKSFFDFIAKLVDHELGFYCDNPDNFPEINSKFISPYKIEDCIIELSKTTLSNYKKIIESLTIVGCQTLELRSYNLIDLNKISKFLSCLNDSRVRNVEIYLEYSEKVSTEDYISFVEKHKIVGSMVIHSCPHEITVDKGQQKLIVFLSQKISSANCCGKINKNLFKVNLPFYLESLSANNCLNRKISIDEKGNIKNCPSLAKSYGNILNVKIEDIVKTSNFRAIWKVKKDDINVCKDCEFRYICSDCRAYVNDKYDKPLNCNYDPYTASYNSP